MDIKARIDALPETEAKAVLKGLIEILANWSPCCDSHCVPCWDLCNEHKGDTCEEIWLLISKEARK